MRNLNNGSPSGLVAFVAMLLAGLLFVASSNPARSYEVQFNASGVVFLRQPIQSIIVNVAGKTLTTAEQAAFTAKVRDAINT